MVVQWLKLHAPTVGGVASIPGQRVRSCMPDAAERQEGDTCHFNLAFIEILCYLQH